MKEAPILLFDFSRPFELVEALKLELKAMLEPDALIHYEPSNGMGVTEALKRLLAGIVRVSPDLLIVLLSDEAQASAPSIFRGLLGQKRCPPIVAVPSSDEPDAIDDLFRLGASDYLIPPFRAVDVRPRLKRLLACQHGRETPLAALKESFGLNQFVGESPALLSQVQKLPQMARCNACVLITGETGTGKEVCARAIHYLSHRADHPFVPLNCGAIPIDLLENELFGHEAGAFTGANTPHAGVIREANGGTLFLDEIDSLSLCAQVKLLRFLQDKEYRPLGARKPSKADVRIIAASNARMDELLNSGKMRQDLFYRLNVLPIHLPPLRERKEDIPLLARHFVAKYAVEADGSAGDIAPAALHKLSLHHWPGNVRELENIIERAVMLSTRSAIEIDEIDLPMAAESALEPESFGRIKSRLIADFERSYLRTLLEQHQGNIAQAARTAQKNRRVFFQLMRKHHIRIEHSAVAPDGKPVVNVVIGVDKNGRPPVHLELE